MKRLAADLRTLYRLTLSPVRGATHAERLESFYSGQADGYDQFRERLLGGRAELHRLLPADAGGIWIDLGGGTGANLERMGERLKRFQRVYLVDLSPSLLRIAARRAAKHGWHNVVLCEADATTFALAASLEASLVTFSYSLTMIPDWFAAVDQAWRLLAPGGTIGVVDFHVSRKRDNHGQPPHGWLTRTLWPAWFDCDNVWLSPDHVAYLHRRFRREHFSDHRRRIPFLAGLRAPYYLFVGQKRAPTVIDGMAGGS